MTKKTKIQLNLLNFLFFLLIYFKLFLKKNKNKIIIVLFIMVFMYISISFYNYVLMYNYSSMLSLSLTLIFLLMTVLTNLKINFIFSFLFFMNVVFFSNLIYFWFFLNKFMFSYQFSIMYFYWIFYGLNFLMGMDGISILLMLLTILLTFCCLLSCWFMNYKMSEFLMILYILIILLMKAFMIFDFYFFFMIFEIMLIPMFLIMGIWGSSGRKVQAAYKFFLYTLFGSIFLLLSLILLWYHLGILSLELFFESSLSFSRQMFIWILLMLGLSMKIPMYPVHIWLPEAHVEAPTFGSVLLAGMLLKLGTYAMYSFILPIFGIALNFFLPFIFSFCLLGMILGSFLALLQIDLKKLIAFSSVSHMNFAMLGLLSSNFQGMEGSLITMMSHGFVSGALFFIVGILYESYGTSLLWYYGGLVLIMPMFSIFFFLFILANFSFPGSMNFIGEFLMIIGMFMDSILILLIALMGLFLVTSFCIMTYGKISYGLLKFYFMNIYSDLILSEKLMFFILLIFIYFFGIIPEFLIQMIFQSLTFILVKNLLFFY